MDTTTNEPTGTAAPIRRGSRWEQRYQDRTGKVLIRRIEIIGAPTLSSPAGYRILRNDAHPHRKGKYASITRRELCRKYQPTA